MDPKDWLYWIFRVLMFIVVVVFIFHMRSRFLQIGTSSYDIENFIYLERGLNKLYYEDPVTGRLYAGMIDLERFNEQNLQKAYAGDTPFGFKITIENFEGESLADTITHNDDQYGFIDPLTSISSNYVSVKSNRYVMARKKEGEIIPARLRINFVYKATI